MCKIYWITVTTWHSNVNLLSTCLVIINVMLLFFKFVIHWAYSLYFYSGPWSARHWPTFKTQPPSQFSMRVSGIHKLRWSIPWLSWLYLHRGWSSRQRTDYTFARSWWHCAIHSITQWGCSIRPSSSCLWYSLETLMFSERIGFLFSSVKLGCLSRICVYKE